MIGSGIRDQRSGIWKKLIQDPRSGSTGQKNAVSWILVLEQQLCCYCGMVSNTPYGTSFNGFRNSATSKQITSIRDDSNCVDFGYIFFSMSGTVFKRGAELQQMSHSFSKFQFQHSGNNTYQQCLRSRLIVSGSPCWHFAESGSGPDLGFTESGTNTDPDAHPGFFMTKI